MWMSLKIISLFILSFFFFIQASWSNKCSVSSETLSDLSIELISYKSEKEIGKILILPPTGGVTYLEKRYARSLCKLGFSSIIIKSWKEMEKETIGLDIHAFHLELAQKVIAKVIELKINTDDFLGILGTSVGAIHSATALGSYDQIQAGFLILGGAPVHKVITHSEEKTLKKYKEKRMKAFGFKSLKDYTFALDKKIPKKVCPLSFAQTVQSKDVFTVIALKDKVVPTVFQKNLQQAFKGESLEISSGHILSIFKFYLLHSEKMTQFFKSSAEKFHQSKAKLKTQ